MSGPFLKQQKPGGKMGLVWIGVPERCDKCKEIYPMSWITFNGKQFICVACETAEQYNPESHFDTGSIKYSSSYTTTEPKNEQNNTDFIEECDCCHDFFSIHDVTIGEDGNQLLCRKCARGDFPDEGPYDKYFRS